MASMRSGLFVPRGGMFSLSLPSQIGSAPAEKLSAVQELLWASFSAGNPGDFQVIESNGQLHIVPVSAKDADEQVVSVEPALNARISIETKDWNGLDLLEAFCQQVTTVTGRRVEVGTIPLNHFAHHRALYGASAEVARDFLSRFLISTGTGYSWRLLFDPTDQVYALNIHWLGGPGADKGCLNDVSK